MSDMDHNYLCMQDLYRSPVQDGESHQFCAVMYFSLNEPPYADKNWVYDCICCVLEHLKPLEVWIVIADQQHYEWAIYSSKKSSRQKELTRKKEIADQLYDLADDAKKKSVSLEIVSDVKVLGWKDFISKCINYRKDVAKILAEIDHTESEARKSLEDVATGFLSQKYCDARDVERTVSKYKGMAVRFLVEELPGYTAFDLGKSDVVPFCVYCSTKKDFGTVTQAVLSTGHSLKENIWPNHDFVNVAVVHPAE
mmetsp:Transcript_15480/g.43884  ORF Transcript_15480/g.43884 Transcript_15480/m.43884 type:complete len:253 (+) Transcript_15480:91-849(+)